jgi:patatin-like phospholipase/acyl hydrolase
MFKILTIDGGGIKGVFPAALLTEIEDAIGTNIGSYFDLIAGTSTGGIIALALALRIKAKEILRLYIECGPKIFPSSMDIHRRVLHYVRCKYKTDPLSNALKEVFQDHKLGDCRNRILIPTFNAQNGSTKIYKTPHHERFERDWIEKVVDVALATSAAPTYFAPYVSRDMIALIDGGIWANNPTGIAVVEAIGVLKQPAEEIRTLSIGCTCEPQNFMLGNKGLIGWRRKAIEAALCGQSFGSMGIATMLIGPESITRIDPPTEPGRFHLDNAKRATELAGLGKEAGRQHISNLRRVFFEKLAGSFTPLYGTSTSGSPT